MKFNSKFGLLFVIWSLLLPAQHTMADASAFLGQKYFQYTDERVDFIPEARVFRGKIGKINMVCMDIGPEDGTPLQLEGGIGLTVLYLRKFIRDLNTEKFRVFVCNRPGQGSGLLYSGRDTPAEELGVDGMLKVFPALRNFIYQVSGKKKVVVAGHSLGGIAVRAGSLGIEFDEQGLASISSKAAALARRQTALIVPMFTLPMTGENAIEGSSVYKMLHLKDVLPHIANLFEMFHTNMPWPVTAAMDQAIASYVKISQNNMHQDLFGAPDLDLTEIFDLGRFILPQRVSPQLVSQDAHRWHTDHAYTTHSHFDFGQKFYNLQISDKALPMLAFVGNKDTFTDSAAFLKETENFKNTQTYAVDSGHIGAFLSRTVSGQMARVIRRAYEERMSISCRQWLSQDYSKLEKDFSKQ